MGPRKKGRRVDGWLVVDKPLGITSAAVVNAARRALDAQKAGHSGTLDPLATGVLAIAFGEATKTVPAAQDGAKSYRFTVRLGQRTTTDDAEGEVIAESPARPSDDEIRAALRAFEGEIAQVPPVFSAVKVAGERAYDLARAGEIPELAPRPLTVHRIALTARPDPDHAEIEMVCGKGGYVRSVARDLGEALGCHGHVSALRRLATGPFRLEHAIAFEKIGEMLHEGGSANLLPVATGLDDIPALAVTGDMADRLRRGQAVPVPPHRFGEGATIWAAEDGVPVAIGTQRGGLFHPGRVFNPND
jgi:tRNA pseudouridine55 synthase